MTDPRTTVCVFVKTPRAGHSKTRLAASIGHEAACELAGAFFRDTLELVRSRPWSHTVVFVSGDPSGLGLLPAGVPVWQQGAGDLGDRMELAFRAVLPASPRALIVGTDSPGMPAERLDEAHEALREADAVLGPADDGGFYLVGLARCPGGTLSGLPWSAPDTLSATRDRLRSRGFSPRLLEPWFDVDERGDLERLSSLLEGGNVLACHSARVLDRIGALS